MESGKINFKVNDNSAVKKGKKYGTLAGALTGGAYCAHAAKDTFASSIIKAAAEHSVSRNKAVIVASGILAGILAGCTLAGRAIGTVAGKIVQNHKDKQTMTAVNEAVENMEEPVSVDDLITKKDEQFEKFMESDEKIKNMEDVLKAMMKSQEIDEVTLQDLEAELKKSSVK